MNAILCCPSLWQIAQSSTLTEIIIMKLQVTYWYLQTQAILTCLQQILTNRRLLTELVLQPVTHDEDAHQQLADLSGAGQLGYVLLDDGLRREEETEGHVVHKPHVCSASVVHVSRGEDR